MVEKNPPPGCNLGPKFPPHAVHLPKKNDDIAVQYKDVHDLGVESYGASEEILAAEDLIIAVLMSRRLLLRTWLNQIESLKLKYPRMLKRPHPKCWKLMV